MKKRNRNKADIFQAYEFSEHAEIYEIVKKREQTPLEEYLSHEEMLQKLMNSAETEDKNSRFA